MNKGGQSSSKKLVSFQNKDNEIPLKVVFYIIIM